MKKLKLLLTALFLATIILSANAQTYNAADKTALRAFLQQESATTGVTNGKKLGLEATDMATWNDNEVWVPKVQGVTWKGGRISAVNWSMKMLGGNLNLQGCTNLTSLNCSFNGSLKSLNVSGNTNLITLQCDMSGLTVLNIASNTKLTDLSCYWNNLTALDVSAHTELLTLDCSSNIINTLNVANNTKLESLICSYNPLNTLVVTNNPRLKTLECTDNKLKELKVSANTALTRLVCGKNLLTTLDVAKNTLLQHLECYDNQLEVLDLTFNTQLLYINCSKNALTSLNVKKSEKLEELFCSENKIVELNCAYTSLRNLDMSNNAEMTSLDCTGSQLKSLNLSDKKNLVSLKCASAPLTSLDLSACNGLGELDCGGTNIGSLNLSDKKNLKILRCSDISTLTSLDLSACSSLEELDCLNTSLISLDLTVCNKLNMLSSSESKLRSLKLSEASNFKIIISTDTSLPMSAISEIVSEYKLFNNQHDVLYTDTIAKPGYVMDLSKEIKFGASETVFSVTKNGGVATLDADYTHTDGVYTLLAEGEYMISMTNAALKASHNLDIVSTGKIIIEKNLCGCIPDIDCKDLYCPTQIAEMTIDEAVVHTITINVPEEYQIMENFKAGIVKIVLPETAEGVPEGLNWCVSETVLLPNNSYCCRLWGTPTKAGTYEIKVVLKITAKIFNSETTIDYPIAFTLNIKDLGTDIDNASTMDVALYPNPVKESFTIGGDIEIKQVSIYNMAGHLEYSGVDKNINISNLPSGVYNVRITDTDENVIDKRLIKR